MKEDSCAILKYDCGVKLCDVQNVKIPYFPAHKTHRDFFVRNFRKKNVF